jgi:hypothetical protein
VELPVAPAPATLRALLALLALLGLLGLAARPAPLVLVVLAARALAARRPSPAMRSSSMATSGTPSPAQLAAPLALVAPVAPLLAVLAESGTETSEPHQRSGRWSMRQGRPGTWSPLPTASTPVSATAEIRGSMPAFAVVYVFAQQACC